MRNLTIERRKSFVGCLGKMKIYVEDPFATEISLQNVPCRKLGEIKNGEQKTFQIPENEAKIFVIADALSKNYCCEFFQLPQGDQDIFLAGQNKFNPAAGNPFQFDHNENPKALELRKKGTKKGAVILTCAIVFGFLAGYAIAGGLFKSEAEAKTFSAEGLQITLTDEFKKAEFEGQTVVYDSSKVAVFALKEKTDSIENGESITLQEYAKFVTDANNQLSESIQTKDGLTWFEYEFYNEEEGKTFHYFAYVYKADDAFWLVQFAVYKENVDKLRENITEWAKSVSFPA